MNAANAPFDRHQNAMAALTTRASSIHAKLDVLTPCELQVLLARCLNGLAIWS